VLEQRGCRDREDGLLPIELNISSTFG
jgi:hypothetical protein